MNKLTKLIVSVISSVMIMTSASAGEFSVTGGVKATYTILGNTGTAGTHGLGRGLGISNEFSLSASGELDNSRTRNQQTFTVEWFLTSTQTSPSGRQWSV